MTTKRVINNVPDYHNWSYGPINNGCIPSSMANLIAYYDNEQWNNLSTLEGTDWQHPYSGYWIKYYFPMNHSDDKSLVDDLIIDLAMESGNCIDLSDGSTLPYSNCHGVTEYETVIALNNILDDANIDAFSMFDDVASNINDITNIISRGHPIILIAENYQGQTGRHAVTGVGYVTYNSNVLGFLVHDDWNSTGKEIYLSTTAISNFITIFEI